MKKTFNKAEKLSKKKLIEELFQKGSYFYSHPFKVIYLKKSDVPVTQILISVPKRNFKLAVARNKLKRRIRESYRLNKDKLYSSEAYLIGYIYTSKELLNYNIIEKGVIKSIEKLEALSEK